MRDDPQPIRTIPVPPPDDPKRSVEFVRAELIGDVYAVTPDGRRFSGNVVVGRYLPFGTHIFTGEGAHLRVVLPDESVFSIGANADFVMDEFVYDPVFFDSYKNVVFTLLKGSFRWVTGKVARSQPDYLHLKIKSVAIGTRGTDFEVWQDVAVAAWLRVYEGAVAVLPFDTDKEITVSAGQQLTIDRNGDVQGVSQITDAPILPDTSMVSSNVNRKPARSLPLLAHLASKVPLPSAPARGSH